jgi:hypothetical protein
VAVGRDRKKRVDRPILDEEVLGMTRVFVKGGIALWLTLAWCAGAAFAQSQAINGTIEGVVTDQSGAALPGVNVTVANLDTGETRVVVSNSSGVYRPRDSPSS